MERGTFKLINLITQIEWELIEIVLKYEINNLETAKKKIWKIGCRNGVAGTEFAELIRNVTVPLGREAVLSCVINDLGAYKVC